MAIYKNQDNGFCVFRLHYSADEDKNTIWAENNRKSYPSEDIWNQEMELDFTKSSGSRIYPEFKDNVHVKTGLKLIPLTHLYRFWDFGYRHPVVLFCQINPFDQLVILDEMFGTDIVIFEFAEQVKKYTEKNFPGIEVEDYCDPAGKFKSDKSNKTTLDILRQFNIIPRYKMSQVTEGINLIRKLLLVRKDGMPGMIIDRKCRVTLDGFLGGYTRNEITDEPVKDGYYEHPQDALRYGVINLFSAKTAQLIKPDFVSFRKRFTFSKVAGY